MANINPNPTHVIPEWSHPVLPGNGLQGCFLITTSDFLENPQSTSLFKWIKMEDAIGTANLRLTYDDENDVYLLEQAKGHLSETGEWSYEWSVVGRFTGLSEEAEEAIRGLVYVNYIFESTSSHLKVTGVKRDGSTEVLCNASFATVNYVQEQLAPVLERLTALEEKCAVIGDTETFDLVQAGGSTIQVKLVKGV